MMKQKLVTVSLLTLLALAFALPASAERGDDANRKSKNGRTAGDIDGVGIDVEYGRPQVKERNIWGSLVPYDQVWRTGADEATTISFDRDVLIEGDSLPAGRYALFTIPGAESWTVIFNDTPDQWGAFSYAETEDALRVRVAPQTGDFVETLTFLIEGARVVLRWENLAVGFTVASAD